MTERWSRVGKVASRGIAAFLIAGAVNTGHLSAVVSAVGLEELGSTILTGGIRQDCDTVNFQPGHRVFIELWQNPNGSTYEKPGVDTGEICTPPSLVEVMGFAKINEMRLRERQLPLAHSWILQTAAEERLKQIILPGRFSHYGPGGERLLSLALGKIPGAPSPDQCGEILGRTNLNSDEEAIIALMSGFQNSQSHHDLIMDGSLTVLGLSIRRGSDGMLYLAGVFCRSPIY